MWLSTLSIVIFIPKLSWGDRKDMRVGEYRVEGATQWQLLLYCYVWGWTIAYGVTSIIDFVLMLSQQNI
jgi:hypothetical protein